MKMKITKEGWAVLDDDSHISRWVEDSGLIDHGQKYEMQYSDFGVKPGDKVVDIGTFIGDTTVPLARLVGEKGEVYAFEPHPIAFACLVYNTRLYPQVKCFNYALGAHHGITGLSMAQNGGASHLSRRQDSWSVVMATLDSVWINPVSFMKIDVEGFELSVLEGAAGFIDFCRPNILVETATHGERYFPNSRERLYEWFKKFNYNPTVQKLDYTAAPQYDVFATPGAWKLSFDI
jgi:FkbM family methyltransferase